MADIQRIQFGSKEIIFSLTYQDRKSLGITVHPDRSITVKAPANTSYQKIQEKIRKRAPWILRQQSYFLTFEPRTPPRKYVSGESHLYLGKKYRLKIIQSSENQVKLKRGFFEIHTTDKSKNHIKSLLNAWYEEKARSKFPKLTAKWIERFRKYDVEPSDLIIQWMEKRWGSCTPKGRIILNIELIKAPKRCIEYVIVHEMCHLVYHDHSSEFFSLQHTEIKDWKRLKKNLEELLA